MGHHIEITVSPGGNGPGDGVLVDGRRIDCKRVSLSAGAGEMTVVILEVPAARVTVHGRAAVVSQVPEPGGA